MTTPARAPVAPRSQRSEAGRVRAPPRASADLTIPPTAFVSAGGVINAVMAAGLGGGADEGSGAGPGAAPASKKKASKTGPKN